MAPQMKKTKIIFTERALPFVLEAIGKSINDKGFLIDSNTKELTLDKDGKKIKAKKIIAISKDKFVTNFCDLIDMHL